MHFQGSAEDQAHETGSGMGTGGGRGLSQRLILQLIATIPYATLSHECARVLGEPVRGCNCKNGLIRAVPPEVLIQAAAPEVLAQAPVTRVPTALVPAVRTQIANGIVPSPKSRFVIVPAAKARVIRAVTLSRHPTAEDLNATLRGFGYVVPLRSVPPPPPHYPPPGAPYRGRGRPRVLSPFGAAGDDKEPPQDFEQAQEAKKGISTWWGTGVDPDKVPPAAAAKAAASGWPPPAAYRPGNWNFDESSYVLAFGDTLSGLAITYLGSPQRWKEIWNANPQDWRWNHNPDKLMAGEKILMPLEAKDMAIAMLSSKSSNPQASTTGKKAPIDVPGENPLAPTVEGGTAAAAKSSATKYLIPAAIGVTVLGVGYYILS